MLVLCSLINVVNFLIWSR
jgi:hypothetical protein